VVGVRDGDILVKAGGRKDKFLSPCGRFPEDLFGVVRKKAHPHLVNVSVVDSGPVCSPFRSRLSGSNGRVVRTTPFLLRLIDVTSVFTLMSTLVDRRSERRSL
jgi:hypothetical protein